MQRIARHILPRAKTDRRPRLTVVVPAYNEQASIGRVVEELEELRSIALTQCRLDFVVVDDGSRDATRARAQEAGAKVISLPFNLGIGLAVQTGYQYALDHGARFVVQVDGDGQHLPSEIAKLLPPLLQDRADVVIGSRFLRNKGARSFEATTKMRWLAGRLLSVTIHFLTGQRISDTTSGFRIYNRRAAEFVAANYPDDYPEVQVLVSLARNGFRIVEVPVRMRGRVHGRSSINWWQAVYYVVKVTFASFMDKARRS